MAFVKIDTGMLDSTLWFEKDQRDVFITALLMAEPREFMKPVSQLKVNSLEETGFVAPAGWYGFCAASGPGIVRRSLADYESGMTALVALGEPEAESRSREFEGRRLIRIDGGYVVLNYMKYRDKDYTAAERMRRLRERRKSITLQDSDGEVTNVTRNVTDVRANVTQAESRVQSTDKEQIPSPKPRKRVSEGRKKKELVARPTKTDFDKSRHREFKTAIFEYWQSKNQIDCPWGQPEGMQLEIWLRANPTIVIGEFKSLLRNRYKSDVNHSERPSKWIRNATDFAGGALDRFSKPQNGGNRHGNNGTAGRNGENHGSATRQRLVNNLEALYTATLQEGES